MLFVRVPMPILVPARPNRRWRVVQASAGWPGPGTGRAARVGPPRSGLFGATTGVVASKPGRWTSRDRSGRDCLEHRPERAAAAWRVRGARLVLSSFPDDGADSALRSTAGVGTRFPCVRAVQGPAQDQSRFPVVTKQGDAVALRGSVIIISGNRRTPASICGLSWEPCISKFRNGAN